MKISTLFRTAVLLIALIGTALTATAYSFEKDGIYYIINIDGKTVSVTYKDTYYNSYSGIVNIPSIVSYSNTSYSVTSIGYAAFRGCGGLTSVTIPNTVNSIGGTAFYGCARLASITIPKSVNSIGIQAFYGCSGLKTLNYNAVNCASFDAGNYGSNYPFYQTNIETINIGDSVQVIPICFAYKLTKLASISIPSSVNFIGGSAFKGCTGLSSITIPSSVNSIGGGAFQGCSGLKTLNYNAVNCADFSSYDYPFDGTSISTINIGNSVQSIPMSFAYKLTSLTSVTIPSSVNSIGGGAFQGCSGLKTLNYNAVNCADFSSYDYPFDGTSISTINIGNNVQSIPMRLAYKLTSLTRVSIGNSVNNISEYAFYGCSKLATVTFGNSVKQIGNYAFKGCSGLSTVIIYDSVKTIGNEAFSDCSGLTSVTIGSSVTTISSSAFKNCSSLTALNYNAVSCGDFNSSPFLGTKISTINVGDGVLSLPANFVNGLKSLLSITIPNSLTVIGQDAFNGCTGMTGVHIRDLTAWLSISFLNAYGNPLINAHHLFLNGQEIQDLVIPNEINYIPFAAFYGCSSLKSVTIPDHVNSIIKSAFAYCSELITVRIGNNVSAIGENAFYECNKLYNLKLGSALSDIKMYAFYNCSSLPSIEIPSTVSSIGSYAFYGCANLSQATLPNAISSIEDYTFYGCKRLEDINLTNVQNVGNYAFSGCTGVKNMTIGKSLSWGENAFSGCAPTKLVWNAKNIGHIGITTSNISQLTIGSEVESLPNNFVNGSQITSVTIPNSVKTIGDGAFCGCTSMTRATIGNSVISIGNNAFNGCSKLSNITIPNSVKTVGTQAFYGCSNLNSATIGNSVNTLEYRTFYGCSNLKRLIIGNSVNSIKESVFGDCKNLTQVYCRAIMPPRYEANLDYYPLFEDIVYQNAILYVPDLTHGYYLQAEPWKRFMEIKTESYSDDDISFSSSVYPTSIRMAAVNIAGTQQANDYFIFEGVKYNPLVVTGLEPNSIYSGSYTMKTAGTITEIPFKFYTSELKMVAEGAKSLTETTVLLKAETNMADEETMCGFDWRLYEGPDDYLGTRVYCPVYDGTMAGTLKGLKKDTYYKYRPVYKSNDNNVYYGDWVTFYTGDVGVEFDPVVYTYNSPEVTQTSAVLQGVALRGSDEITEQGFEYWRKNGTVSKVAATGERMSANVTGLQAGTAYTFRAYLKAGGKTSYGANVDFVTVAGGLDVNADGVVNIADINVIINYILSGNQSSQGDVNGDGVVNIGDVNLIINDILNH